MQKSIFFLLLIIVGFQSSAQDEELGKRTTLIFVSSEILANDNFDKDEFLDWARRVQETVGGFIKTEKTNTTLKVLPTWTTKGKCSYEISVCPANEGLTGRVLAALNTIESPVAKIAAYQVYFSFKFNDGCKESEKYSPQIFTATEKLMLDMMGQSSLGRRKETLRNWALEEVIPVLSYYTVSVDPQFEGVRYTGAVLDKKTFLNKKTTAVTDINALYWRGVLEMSQGNLIIPISKIYMHIANDEFDLARRYMGMIYRFTDKKTLGAHYLIGLNNYLDIFYQRHDSLVRQGIAFHDKGKFDEAIKVYTNLLSEYPNSAWALYEIYFSIKGRDAGRNPDKTTELWNEHKAAVYAADPLYPMGGGANSAKDGYTLLRHMEINELFKDGKKLKEDMIRYGDIALDLENYSFAAHLYWNLVTLFPEEKYKGHSFLVYFLYSLQKMGVEEVQSFFKENYKNEFNIIDTERTEAIKNNPTYKSFKEQ